MRRSRTDRHLLQAAGQAGGGGAVAGLLGVVQALQRTPHAVAAGQRGAAAAAATLVRKKPQRVRLRRLRNQTGKRRKELRSPALCPLPEWDPHPPLEGGGLVQNLSGLFLREGDEVRRLDVGGAAGLGLGAVQAFPRGAGIHAEPASQTTGSGSDRTALRGRAASPPGPTCLRAAGRGTPRAAAAGRRCRRRGRWC